MPKTKEKQSTSRSRESAPRRSVLSVLAGHFAARGRALWPPLLILVAGIAVYSNTFSVPFHFDDFRNIRDNPAIRTWWPPWDVLAGPRPVPQYTFALNYAVHGYDVWGYHLVNLAIHVSAGLLLYGVVRRTLSRTELPSRWGAAGDQLALVVALIWTVHPLQTQAVTYIVQRHESLMGMLFLATFYAFLRAQEASRPRLWYGAAIGFCALGMASKEVMAAAPPLVLWYDRVFMSGSWGEIVRRRKGFYLGLLATYGLLAPLVYSMIAHRESMENVGVMYVEGITPWRYLLSQSGVIVHYLGLSVWPRNQCFDYGWPAAKSVGEVLPQALVVVSLLAATVWSVFRHPKWSFLGGWFFLILAPTSSVVPIRDLAFEHRMYLPLAAVAAVGVLGTYVILTAFWRAFHVSPTWKTAAHLAVSGTAVLLLACAANDRNSVYATEISLWSDVVRIAPLNARGWVNLGMVLHENNQSMEALACLERAIQLAPNDAGAHRNLGCVLHHFRRFSEAAEHYEVAIRLGGKDDELLALLAAALVPLGRAREAEELCRTVLQQRPDSVMAHVNLANALAAEGRITEALPHFQEALKIAPETAEAHAGIARIVADRDPKAARDHLAEAIRLRPNSPNVHLEMGNLVAKTKPQAAIRHYEAALRLDPEFPDALFNLANAWVACGHPEKAIPYLEKAVALAPEWTEAKNNLRILREAFEQRGGD